MCTEKTPQNVYTTKRRLTGTVRNELSVCDVATLLQTYAESTQGIRAHAAKVRSDEYSRENRARAPQQQRARTLANIDVKYLNTFNG